MMSTENTPQLDYQQAAAFKIWYGDGSTYSSNDGLWNDAPDDNVQVVMIYFTLRDNRGRYTRLYSSGCDYYALNAQGAFTSSFDDVSKVEGRVLNGKFMNWEGLASIEKLAFDDYGSDLVEKPVHELVK